MFLAKCNKGRCIGEPEEVENSDIDLQDSITVVILEKMGD
jgi:hypothetical protein